MEILMCLKLTRVSNAPNSDSDVPATPKKQAVSISKAVRLAHKFIFGFFFEKSLYDGRRASNGGPNFSFRHFGADVAAFEVAR